MTDETAADIAPRPSTIDIAGIMAAIPHRYPMLLIDRIVDVVYGESAVGSIG